MGILARVKQRHGGRSGSVVLIVAMLLGVLGASLGVGYTATRPIADSGGTHVTKGDTVAYVNAESGLVEAEAPALAPKKHPLEVVTLPDGRVAVVDHTNRTVQFVNPATMRKDGKPIDKPDATGPSDSDDPSRERRLAVVAGPDKGYLLDIDKGTVEPIDPTRPPAKPSRVPGGLTGAAVADRSGGVWVLTRNGQVAHVTGSGVEVRALPDRVEHLTTADGRPIGITESGEVFDVASAMVHRITTELVPHGDDVVVGSPKGPGRFVLIVDRRAGQLVAIDPGTGGRRGPFQLPRDGRHRYGPPVQAGDVVYVPDYAPHVLHGLNLVTGRRLAEVSVPGKSPEFDLEVKEGRVWANDRLDRRARVIKRDGTPDLVDKGTGHGVETDTTNDGQQRPEPKPRPDTEPTPAPGPAPEPKPGPVDTGPPAAPAPKRTEPNEAPVERIAVPAIAPGTKKDEACRTITQAGHRCQPVAKGSDGPTDTVIRTDPAAGTLWPKGHVVIVEHYGQVTVPSVVGTLIGPACDPITTAGLGCTGRASATPAASLAELGVVTAQTPAAGSKADYGSPVTLDHPDKVTLGNYVGRPAAEVCVEIEQQSNGQVTCAAAVQGPPENQANQPRGTVLAQQPAVVQINEKVMFTVVSGPVVPPVVGEQWQAACGKLEAAGYLCYGQSDGLAKDDSVVSQEPAPGTPWEPGNNVVIHYSPNKSVPVKLYQNNGVSVLRLGDDPAPGYVFTGELGYAYRPGTTNQVGLAPMIYGFHCRGPVPECGGFDNNHFYSRVQVHEGWVRNDFALFIERLPDGSCGAGQRPLYRNWYDSGQTRRYTVEEGSPDPARTEPLGCVWI